MWDRSELLCQKGCGRRKKNEGFNPGEASASEGCGQCAMKGRRIRLTKRMVSSAAARLS